MHTNALESLTLSTPVEAIHLIQLIVAGYSFKKEKHYKDIDASMPAEFAYRSFHQQHILYNMARQLKPLSSGINNVLYGYKPRSSFRSSIDLLFRVK